ncbi:hypothetical protein Nans01_14010 [Nocardiopsis ansamitocini]|uniref:Uncharacterized protein n=1 Tax=Nocardiopsis ansamitocini TaxID=1670832 RepID=A0A9W6P497_9ACTN|nr:hypothetical protein Nans01_14010 [Nocardiopsis ansamitocini]
MPNSRNPPTAAAMTRYPWAEPPWLCAIAGASAPERRIATPRKAVRHAINRERSSWPTDISAGMAT